MSKYRDAENVDDSAGYEPSKKLGTITPEKVRRQNLNPYPESENEVQAMMIAPQAGRAQIGRDLDEIYKIKHADKRMGSAWDYFTAQTSDTRLSNLKKEQELAYVRWAIEVQGKCLMMGLSKSSALADWMRSTVCEPGLARDGFLRNNLQTINTKSENINVENVEKSRSIFGLFKGGNNG